MASYHTNTFRLLGAEPHSSSAAISDVACAEKRLGLRLPLSVREWYGYHEAIEILEKHSNQDPPIPIGEFTLSQWGAHRLLPFRIENQGVCIWSIVLDGSDDPPIYVDVDSTGTEWHLQAPTFSAYVYACVWDYKVVFGQPALAQAQNEPLSAEAIADLEMAFVAQPKTYGWPGSTQYRFAGNNHAVLIWAADGQADWFVGACDERSLESALRKVWQLNDVGKSFYDCSEIAKGVLARLRGQAT